MDYAREALDVIWFFTQVGAGFSLGWHLVSVMFRR